MSGFQFATSIIMEGPGMKERDKRKERLLVGRGGGVQVYSCKYHTFVNLCSDRSNRRTA